MKIRSRDFFWGALVFAVGMGVYDFLHWENIIHRTAIIGYVVVVLLFLMAGCILRLWEKNKSKQTR